MKFAFITATPQNSQSGSGTFVGNARLMDALRGMGHGVDVIVPKSTTGKLGYTAHRFGWNWRLHARDFDGYDVVVGLDMDGYTIAHRTRAPFVAYIHGIIADEATFERGAVRTSLELQARAERVSVHRAALVLTTSQYSVKRLSALYGLPIQQIHAVPPPIDVRAWDAACAALSVVPAARPTILCVGVQYPRKNVALLICAAALLRNEFPALDVRIASAGPEWRNLRALTQALGLQGTVSFLGHVPFEHLVMEYMQCTLFCLPSLQEGWGLVFAEAMASRKPVVASRSTSTPEVIEHGVSGLLSAPNDAADLARNIAAVLRDPNLARRLGEAGRARAEQFDAQVIARQFLDVVQPSSVVRNTGFRG